MTYFPMFHYFNFFRIHNVFLGSLAACVAYYIINGQNVYLLLHCIMIIALAMMFGNALNDIIDFKSDEISHPNRMLPMGYININTAKQITGFVFILLIIISFHLPIQASLLVYCFIVPLLILYNCYFKGVPLIGNIIISIILSLTFLFIELVFFNRFDITIVPASLIFGLSIIREILKDIHDYEGDRAYNVYTFPVRFGHSYSIKVVIYMILCFCLLAPMPYYVNYYSNNYLISLIILVEIPMIILVSLLLRNPDKIMISRIVSTMKIINLFGLFVILIANKY